jgi:hypothetical protein
MAEPRRNAERPSGELGGSAAAGAATAERAVEDATAISERARETTASQGEAVVSAARQGLQQATRSAESGANAALRSGVTIADGVREIAETWVHYAEHVMRHSSEAGQALLRCRSWNEILEVQTRLLRDNMHAFLEQSAKVSEIGSRMATRPFEVLTEAGGDKPR